MRLSIVIPALNEATNIVATLSALRPMRARGVEVIVVDGGSTDTTIAAARPLCDQVLLCTPGRATQMNVGANAAHGGVLLFLHADSLVPLDGDVWIAKTIAGGHQWGRFDIRISGSHPLFPVIAWFMNHRSRLTGIATGDQGIFMSREIFDVVGGFPAQPLMEDVEMTSRLKKMASPACLKQTIVTAGRRWEKYGVWRTIFTMWRIRLAYAFGAAPAKLHQEYDGK